MASTGESACRLPHQEPGNEANKPVALCNMCKWRPQFKEDYCNVCNSYRSQKMTWKCRTGGHVQDIPFPLGDDDTWACHNGCQEYVRWDPVNKAAKKVRERQEGALGAIRISYTDSLVGSTSFEHYLTHYNKCKRYPTMGEVRNGMVLLAVIVGQGIGFNASVVDSLITSETDVDNLYTSNKDIKTVDGTGDMKFYFFINKFLHEECDCEVMDAIMPFIRRLNNMIVLHPYIQPQREVYRNQQFMSNTIETLEKGSLPMSIRIPGFLSTSLKDDLKNFKGNAHLTIKIHDVCPNAFYLAKSSAYEAEAEVLFPPYSAFIVRKTKMNDGVLQIWMDAQDNGDVSDEFTELMIH